MDRKIAIVTGVGRLKGIGKAICVELAKNGVDIFFTYWRNYDQQMPWQSEDEEPALIWDEIRRLGVRCEKIELDLREPAAVETLFNEAAKTLGPPSILINNATYSTSTDVFTLTPTELDQHYLVNLKACTLLCVEFVRRYPGGRSGRIVNLTSGQSLSAMSGEIAYAITKAGVETLTKTLAHELATKGITINAVNPGLTDSGWLDEAHRQLFQDRFPMGRFGQPEDAARLIAFLVSEQAGWITGQVIHSEGGFIREKYNG
ncbi:MAG TPA: SDR family oxidoreductase [Hymenobacter sp.]|jgi:3-oxoacyl-[acyl-carrier protein] reductase